MENSVLLTYIYEIANMPHPITDMIPKYPLPINEPARRINNEIAIISILFFFKPHINKYIDAGRIQ